MFQVDKVPLLGIPIVMATDTIRDKFVNIVDKIITVVAKGEKGIGANEKINNYERQIDQMVYKLYGLTKEEIAIVEQPGAKR